jgi:hypothetical protein
MTNNYRQSGAAEGEAVLERAARIAIGDPLLLCVLEIAELNVGALPHLLGVGIDRVQQLLIAVVQELIRLVRAARAPQALYSGLECVLSAQV